MDDLLEMAKELDTMDRSLNAWEAEFLETILTRLREGRTITSRQETKLRQIHEEYLGDGAKAAGGDDIDDDDIFM